MDNLSGQVIKGYELHERIGAGGFGAVYRAHQSTVGREVAIKIILPHFANTPDFIRRFETEAQLVARLEHLHIIPLYDYWRDPDGAYLVVRWMRGGSLRDVLQKGHFEPEAAALLLDQIASALSAAHRNNVVHRDVKPGNILLDEDGNAYLADFGIAKDVSLQTNQTDIDAIVGSPDYISPEQARSEPVTPQTDIYSLGVVLYELLTGQHPFPNLNLVERLFKHLNEPLPLITTLPDEIIADVNTVIQKATAKNPLHRYADALEMAVAFRQAIQKKISENIVETLTQREQEILQRIIEGKSNKQIAEELFIAVMTVKWYITQVYRKLGVRSRVQAIVRARELNLIVSRTGHLDTAQALTGTTVVPSSELNLQNPYKGLRAFQAADNLDFFGREKVIAKLLHRLDESGEYAHFLAVIGPSGSGKSSLVKAGLIPALWRGALSGSEKWFVIEMLPGTHPLDELEVALTRVAANQTANLNEQIRRDKRGLIRIAGLILPNDGSELVIVIDQFEEVFTLVEDEVERLHFLNLLYTAITDARGRVRVVVTLRADFYDRPLHYPEFGELIRSRMETLLPLSAEGLERAISKPAERVGITFEPELVTTIVSEVNYQPGALPLLQYALTELFEQRQGRLLTHEAYQAIGRTTGALARRADEIYLGLDQAGQEAARQMFLRLVTLGEGVEDTRRRVLQSELFAIIANTEVMDEVIETYSNYRLLSLDNDPATRSPTVEVAHEAILREWDRLRVWLNDSREDIRLQRRLATMAADWSHSNQDTSYLARGSRLEQFEKWVADTRLALTQTEQAYLDASLGARHSEAVAEQARQAWEKRLEHRSRNFLRSLVGVFALAAMIALGLTAVAINKANEAQTNATLASARELAAASVNNLSIDPERSLLLALRAVNLTYNQDGTWVQEAEEALHRAVGTAQARRILSAHTGTVNEVSFSPDGKRVASASLDGTSIIWDVATGEKLLTLHQVNSIDESLAKVNSSSELSHEVDTVVYSPDGTRLATGSRGGTVDIWDSLTGKVLFVLHTTYETLEITSASFNPDGTQLAIIAGNIYSSNGTDWNVTIWDLTTTEVTFTFTFSASTPTISDFGTLWGDVTYSPDGQLLALAMSENAEIWSVVTQKKLLTLTGHTRAIEDIAFSPDGKRLATASADRSVKVWDISTPLDLGVTSSRELFTLSGDLGVAFSPDGRRLATASDEGATKIWDANSGTLLFTLTGHSGAVRSVVFSPDGTSLATAGTDKTVRIWNAGPGEELFTVDNILAAGSFSYSPDGTRLVAGDGANNEVRVLDASTGHEVIALEYPGGGQVVYSPDGRRLAAVAGSAAKVWDAYTGEEVFTLTGHGEVLDGIAYSPDGTRLVIGSLDKMAIVWDALTGQQLFTLVGGHTSGIHCVAFSPDGRYVATGGDDHKVIIWDLATKQPLLSLPTQGDAITDLAYNQDGTRLAVASQIETASIWDALHGELLVTLSGHPGAIVGVEYSSDGKLLATTGGLITKVRDALTGQELLTLYGHSNGVSYAAFSPDGKRLATTGYDNSLRAYVLPMEDLLTLARSRVTRSWTFEECKRYLHLDACPAGL